jgi:Domain of unknown function (DUF5658)
MNVAIPCVQCGRVFRVAEQFSGRKIRCHTCGEIQHIPTFSARPADGNQPLPLDVYSLSPELPAVISAKTPGTHNLIRDDRPTSGRLSQGTDWRRFVHASIGETSLLELEILALIALSAADVLVTYVLLQRGPAFYESNPLAHWFFLRWNIAGMAVFKFSDMGVVVVISEIVERHRPGWGRTLLSVSCLVTAAVVWYGLRLLFGHGDNGAPLQ